MSTTSSQPPSSQPVVGRQVKLPISKAVEIAYKSIRLRLSRSLLVTSGIVLALAFLMAIRMTDAITDSMRAWSQSVLGVQDPKFVPTSALEADAKKRFDELSARQQKEQAITDPLEQKIRTATTKPVSAPKDAPAFDAQKTFGDELSDIHKKLGPLPLPPDVLNKLLTAQPDLAGDVKQWIEARRRVKAVEQELNAPRELQAMMRENGVATEPEKIAADKLQTRWLLGLALLVAFVGILNAMLMSVTERFREIGTMKCLGALDMFIVKLFLIESLFQGVVGTTVGIIVGLVLAIVGAWSSYGQFTWMNFPATTVFTSAGFCFVIGVALTVAGAVYPAWQAARMQPIEAMRVET